MNENILDGLSMNLEQANMDKLKSVFPECFTEGKLDIDKLLSLCGEYIDNDFEKYKFEWKGKAECLRLAQKRSAGTLRPCPEESVNWDTTKNLYIEGDNLEVLKLLQTAYYRKVKMIYIDPPYNTGNDFVYEDDFADPLARYKEVTQQTTKSNPETMGRYHTNWLNMMYPRLRLAANLLRDDGVIFISIDDNEVTNLRKICDEVFGEENFIGTIIQNKQNAKNDATNIQKNHEYIISYRKTLQLENNSTKIKPNLYNKVEQVREVFEENGKFFYINDSITTRGDGGVLSARPNLGYTIYYNASTNDKVAICDYDISKVKTAQNILDIYVDRKDLIENGYVTIRPPKVRGQLGVWTWSLEKFNSCKDEIIITGKPGAYSVKKRTFVDKDEVKCINGKYQYVSCVTTNVRSIWDYSTNEGTKLLNDLMDSANTFNNAKNLDLIKSLLNLVNEKNDIILDFFSGSATTAHAVMQLNAEDGGNRQFIMVQLPEVCDEKSEAYKAGYKNICEIGKERIRRAGKKILEENNQMTLEDKEQLDIGFKVFKLDSSNLKTWDNTPVTAEQMDLLYERMNNMIHRVKSDRSDLDMVCEIMLKLGVPLTYSITAIEINGKTAYSIGDDCLLLICLAEDVQPEDVEQMAEYAPAKLIISRESFVDDTAMANAHYILKDHGVELKLV